MLENLKLKLIKIIKDSEKRDLCREKTGSFSIYDEGSGYVLITPVEKKREELRIEHICVVDIEGKYIEVPNGLTPSEELYIHLAVYKKKNNTRSIVHISPTYATVFSVANKVIPPILYDSRFYGGYIYVAPYVKDQSSQLIKGVLDSLNTSDACLIERNGLIVISNNVDDIVRKSIYVEHVAEVYYKTLILNQFKEPERLTKEELEIKKK